MTISNKKLFFFAVATQFSPTANKNIYLELFVPAYITDVFCPVMIEPFKEFPVIFLSFSAQKTQWQTKTEKAEDTLRISRVSYNLQWMLGQLPMDQPLLNPCQKRYSLVIEIQFSLESY